LGRWHSVDPHGEKYYSLSSYTYTGDNPVFFADPNGMDMDGYRIGNGDYKWFSDESADVIGKEKKIWTKVSENRNNFELVKDMAEAGILGEIPTSAKNEEINETKGLPKSELWLDSPSKNIGEGVLKIGASIGYSILNSPKILITGKSLAGSSATPDEKMGAFIDFAPVIISLGMTKTGQILKTSSGLKGYNKFLKEGTTKSIRSGKGWQKSVGRIFQNNKTNQKALESLNVGSFVTGIIGYSRKEMQK